ncbi:MAG: OmpA family protein [bacterium]
MRATGGRDGNSPGGAPFPAVLAACLLVLTVLAGAPPAHAQSSGSGGADDEFTLYPVFIAPGAPRYTVSTRFNLARYDGGTYHGHVFREVRATLRDRSDGTLPAEYAGELYQYEQTLRNTLSVAKRVDRSREVTLTLHGDGFYEAPPGQPLPLRRGFPVMPREEIEAGDTWESSGWMLVDPLWKGTYTRVDFYSGYHYDGVTEYYGRKVHSITAQYAIRYNPGDDPDGDRDLRRITGSHTASILIDVETDSIVLIRDRIDETYTFSNRETLRFDGFALTFVDTPVPMNRTRIAERLQQDLERERIEDVEVQSVEEGVQLRIGNINFEPDRAVILPEDYGRLDSIARALTQVPQDKTFLVVGHTADVGRPEGQRQLSVERAEAVVDGLGQRGIPAGRFVFEGRGGTEPIGDNATAEGRARNRRVELTVLD